MKRTFFSVLVIFLVAAGACTAGPAQTEHPVATDLPRATSTMMPPRPTSTSTVTLTASPTPIFTLEPDRYDPDIRQAVGVDHLQPLIYQADETALLMFFTYSLLDYCLEPQGCRITSRLYYPYGESETFQSMSLVQETVGGSEQWVARLPAADPAGGSLRYYLETSFPEAAYTQRYPVAGTIDLFTTKKLISVELPAAKKVEPGDKMYMFYWGMGPNTVRHGGIRGSPVDSGPSAMDVASDGRIALLNPVNNGVLIYDPKEEAFSNFALPLDVLNEGDLAFDQNDRLVVCDFTGQGATRYTPYCYRMLLDGTVEESAPTYAVSPRRLTEDLRVMDDYDYKLVLPFDAQGRANSREAQRQKQTWELPFGLVLDAKGDWDLRRARFADVKAGLAFEVHSKSVVSTLVDFERTPQGYLILLNSEYQQIRAIWIDPAGVVLKDVSLPNGQYTVLPSGGDAAVDQNGSLYVMSSTENGIEIHFEAAP